MVAASRRVMPAMLPAPPVPAAIPPSDDEGATPAAVQHGEALLHSMLGRLTYGISPASVIGAYTDWLSHLATSPAKQSELAEKIMRKSARFQRFMQRAMLGDCSDCIVPLPQDKRFAHPAWKQLPYAAWAQSFLLAQQWWWNATSGVRGVSRHHEQMVTFGVRQWLDMWAPSNFLLTNPEVLERVRETGGVNLAYGAYNWWRDFSGLMANQPPAGTEAYAPGVNVAITPGRVVMRNRLVELIQYDPATPKVGAEPVFIVPSWIMKYYILDLSPHNSLVRYLVGQGHTVFIVSWKNPDAADRELGMADYLEKGVLAPLREVRERCGGAQVHALGYCLGGTLLAIAAAYLARSKEEVLATLTLLAAELDFEEPGELGLFIDESQIAYLEDIMWGQGYLDGAQMAGAFALMNSKDLVWSKLTHEYLMGRPPAVDDLRSWNADATRLPYRMHSEYLRRLYLNNDLAEGRYIVEGAPVALKDIRVPTLVVATEKDHVSPWKSVYKAHILTDTDLEFVLVSGGHNVGIVCPPGSPVPAHFLATTRKRGEKYRDPDYWTQHAARHEGSWWPYLAQWLAQRTAGKVPARHVDGAALADAPGLYVKQR